MTHLNIFLQTGLRTGSTGFQGRRGDEDDVGFSEYGVNDDNERNHKEEEEGEREIQNFPHQEKIIPREVSSQNLEGKGNIKIPVPFVNL